jgi:hypothetical protein
MKDLLARLEALEVARSAAVERARERAPKTDAERAVLLREFVQSVAMTSACRALAPAPHDGYWPFLKGVNCADIRLRVDALRAMAVASKDPLLCRLARIANRLPGPPDGGEVDLFFREGDSAPAIHFWFPPSEGADLL